jgi:hypothetical protein
LASLSDAVNQAAGRPPDQTGEGSGTQTEHRGPSVAGLVPQARVHKNSGVEKKPSHRCKLFQNGLLTGADGPNYIRTTDGDAAATRRTSLGLLEFLGACKT